MEDRVIFVSVAFLAAIIFASLVALGLTVGSH